MKKLFAILLLLLTFSCFGQDLDLKKPSEGKSLVYFIRGNAVGNGFNFRLYDKDIFLGPLPSRAYFIYECDPGKHLFWGASENRDFIEANLKANKVYVIDVRAKIGVFIAAVSLEPYSPKNKRHLKRLKKALKKHISANVFSIKRTDEKQENITKALDAYNSIKDKSNSKIKYLLPDMNFNSSQ